MAQKMYSAAEVRTKAAGLPPAIIAALEAFAQQAATFVIDWLIGYFGGGVTPAPTPAMQARGVTAPKTCGEYCDCYCVCAGTGIISMHGGNYDDAMQQALMMACCAAKAGDPNCAK